VSALVWFALALLCYFAAFVLIVGLIRASARADEAAERQAAADPDGMIVFHSMCDVADPCGPGCADAR
jgi:hypothetical protein